MITIWTQAYNTEKYIRQCIESVLNQTYTDFEYILVDNGSTDGTGKIIDEYAAKDDRIRVFRETDNYRGARYSLYLDNMLGEYFAALDSDDWLEPDFLMKLYSFCKQEDLDMCVCGSRYYREPAGTTGVLRDPPAKLVFRHEEIPSYFIYIHAFLRTTWGKLIRTEALRNANLTLYKHFSQIKCNGSDTAFSMSIFEGCEKIGMLNGCLHYYRIREGSAFREYSANRYDAYEELYDQTIRVLSKFGELNPNNRNFTAFVFFNAIKDIFDVCINSRLCNSEKVTEISEILGKSRVLEVRKADTADEGLKIIMPYVEWILKKKKGMKIPQKSLRKILTFVQPAFFEVLGDDEWDGLLKHFQIPADIIRKNYRLAYEGLATLAERNPMSRVLIAESFCLSKIQGDDSQRLNYYFQTAKKYPTQKMILQGLSMPLLKKNKLLATLDCDESIFDFYNVVEAVYKGDYSHAINCAASMMQNQDFENKLSLARLMKLVSAVENDSTAFVYFSKVCAAELLSADLFNEAAEALRELQKTLPQDPDVRALVKYLPAVQKEG